MAASLVVVAVTGLWVAQIFPTGQNANDPELVADAQLSAADQAAAPAQPEVEFEEAPAGGLFSPFAGSGQPTVSQDRLGGYVASRTPVAAPTERRAFANQLPGPPAGGRGADLIAGGEAILADAVVDLSEADTNKPAATVSEWDAGEDVRVLSLRLNQLARSSEGLSWDEPPTPLGASGPEADAPAEGIRSVRADNPPARVDVQMRSSEQRDDQ